MFDNIFTERLWRSVEYEEASIKDYQVCKDTREGLEKYFSLELLKLVVSKVFWFRQETF